MAKKPPPPAEHGGRIVPDDTWPGMFRVVWADGTVSDMVNLTRAKQAARGDDNGSQA